MNKTELKMVTHLKDLRDRYGVMGVKAEFEAEGTRTEELIRLKEICLASDVTLTLKIGGCEAIRDMYDARAIGVEFLVAPMVETAFALQKYLRAIDTAFPKDEQAAVGFLINVETQRAVENFPEMLAIPEIDMLNGVVVGRVDLTGSMGLDRKSVNSSQIFTMAEDVFKRAKERNMECVLGGAISQESLPFLSRFKEGLVERYETRKICFSCADALSGNPEEGIRRAVEFELLWLQNKRNYYRSTSDEDSKRIEMLEERCKQNTVNV